MKRAIILIAILATAAQGQTRNARSEVAMPAPVPLRYVSNITRVSKDLNWRPRTGIDDGLNTIL